ncbi:conserved hypothetical protein [Trichormus variabilis ATCC 29413]|uniref:RNA polymerase subunit sigma-70 n=2 Tax=Anabaena variabilis TaxID=264691 RepID=Q3M8C3_TRIV2|nr:conserved hypothetical protein [Trichormus variabilis ATCC 29413]QFZ13971.1 sigma-70 family RNA polymerase sigma factor [Anabaena sp. YBS01]QHD82192.1 sigma-70 family RNA polymerase sigma factor [Trichormus variabilis 0441]
MAKLMQIPHFSEANHPLVKSLFHHSDQELLDLFQHNPDAGKYFTVIFCRYSPIVYTLIQHSARSPVQADYLFALTWRHIYYELGGLDLKNPLPGQEGLTLQNWLINITAYCINEIQLPPTEAIHYSLQATSPPLWCYVEQALDQLPPMLRLMVLMAQTFHWSETRIAAYLQAEGEKVTPAEVANFLQEGYRMLEDKLPADIRTIYLGEDLVKS